MLQQRKNISTLLPLQSKESFGGFCYVHTTNTMSIAARDWYTNTLQSIRDSETVGKNLPNFPTVFRYSINRAAMRTKED